MRKARYAISTMLALAFLTSAAALAQVQTPLSAAKVPQFKQRLDLLDLAGVRGVPVALGNAIDVSLCEFQTNILPPGTPVAGAVAGVAPATWVWGYQVGQTCVPGLLPHSYLGPVVVASRGTPTAMTFWNHLPNANVSNVKAYTTSTDQTLIWGDPLSLNTAPPPINFNDPAGTANPENNDCWSAVQNLLPLPAPCLNNYGFLGPQALPPNNPLTYAAPTPAAVHIHGGEVPSVLDGGPDSWWTGNGIYGHGWYTRHVKSLPTFAAALPALPQTVAGLPLLPAAVLALPLLPDPLYPPDGITTYFDQATLSYYVNIGDVWTAATVVFPLGAVVFDSTGGAYFQNVQNVWTAATVTYPLDALIQVAGAGYVNQGNAWVGGIAPFANGQLVFNEADGQHYDLVAGVWQLATVLDRSTYVYPNGQEAAPVWFHDHMLGATRLNVYAGIAGGYVITEPASTLAPGLHPLGLSDATWVPGPGQTQDDRPLTGLVQPLIIQDRMFDTAGQLYFPNVGINPEHPFWIPEFVGDVILVNGKAWPFLRVQPKRYKFIVLNGSNARAYELFLKDKTLGVKGPSIWVVGNDQGYLDTAQLLDPNVKPNNKLAIMPGERYEIVIDFTGLGGHVIEMDNTARTPYNAGAPVNGATTGRIMRFLVGATPVVDNSFNPAVNPTVRATPMVRLANAVSGTVMPGVTVHKVRRLTVNEVIGAGGPLEVLVNNTLYDGSKPRAPFNDFTPITSMWNTSWYSELPHEGETELWEIVNLTADAHPMHPHLLAHQVVNRQPLDVLGYTAAYNALYAANGMPVDGFGPPLDYNCGLGAPGRGVLDPAVCVLGGNPDPAAVGALLGPPVPPMAQEVGWKDTVQVLPNMVTRILVRFGKPDLPATTPADLVGYDFSPNGGHGYVWHCHIVDHEDNEMMRPYTVIDGPYPVTYAKGIEY